MLTFLSGVFVKDKEGTAMRQAYGTLCSIVGILLNLCLFAGKYVAGMLSGSVALIADAWNNLSDAASSVVTLLGFLFAGKRPDLEHPFGHGRYEYVAGLIVALAILMMGLELFKSSITKILHPEPIETGILTFAVLLISILVKVYMAFYNHKIGKEIGSVAMEATAKDSMSDVIATTVVLISMVILHFTSVNTDGCSGALVSLFILYTGYQTVKETLNPLIGTAPDEKVIKQIEEIVMSDDMVQGYHDLIVHDYGPGRRLLSLHVEVPGECSVYEAHAGIDRIEKRINEALSCVTVIHMDPSEADNGETIRVKEMVLKKVKAIDSEMSIHDFHLIPEKKGTRLMFDAVMPYDSKYSPALMKEKIEQSLKEIPGNYNAEIHVDLGYMSDMK